MTLELRLLLALRQGFGPISIWVRLRLRFRFRFRPDLPARPGPARIRLDRIGSDRLLPLPMQSVGMGAREARPR